MELRQLRYFLLVADEKSLLGASKKAYISHQALSKIIQSLEQELGAVLFLRSRSGVELTQAGHKLLSSASGIIAEVDELISDFEDSPNCTDRNQLRLGLTYGLMELFSLNLVSEFEYAHPEWRLSFMEGTDRIIEQGVCDELLDIGCISGLSENDLLDHQLIAQSKTLLAMHRENPLVKQDLLELRDLSEQVFLTSSSDYFSHKVFVNACRSAGFEPDIAYQTTSLKIIVQLLKMNKGVFACAQNTLSYFTHPDIVVRPIKDDPYIFRLYLIKRKGAKSYRSVEVFTEFFVQLLDNPHLI
jgi:DNA-binding transcriptional LysR family regulator